MAYTIAQLEDIVTVLQDHVFALEKRLDALPADTPGAESLERIINVKWRLLDEQRDLLERAYERVAREAAAARWQHHFDNDTQNTY